MKIINRSNGDSTRTISLFDLAMVLMLVCCFAFDDISNVGIIAELFFVIMTVLSLISKSRHVEKTVSNYFAWLILFVFYSGLSYLWASKLNVTVISCTISVIQVGVLALCLLVYLCNRNKVYKFIHAYILTSYIILVRFLFEVPMIYWGHESRFGKESLFGKNETAIVLSIAALFIICELVQNKEKNRLLIKLLSVFAFLLVVILMGTKSGLFVFLVGVILLFVVRANNPIKLFAIVIAITFGIAAIYYLIMNNRFLYNSIGYRIEAMLMGISGGTTDASTSMRINFTKDAIQIFKKNPIIGVGLDGYRYVNKYEFTYSHNNYTEILANLGLIGFFLYYSRFISYIKSAIKLRKNEPLALVLLVALLFIDFTGVTYSLEDEYFLLSLVLALLKLRWSSAVEKMQENDLVVIKKQHVQIAEKEGPSFSQIL